MVRVGRQRDAGVDTHPAQRFDLPVSRGSLHEGQRTEGCLLLRRDNEVGQSIGADVAERDAVARVAASGGESRVVVDSDRWKLVARHGEWSPPLVSHVSVQGGKEFAQRVGELREYSVVVVVAWFDGRAEMI